MISVVTHMYPRHHVHKKMFELSLSYNKSVAEKLGWNFIGDSKRRVPNLILFRERSAIIVEAMSAMQDEDKILWIDGDALIVGNNTPSIFDELGSADIGMVKTKSCWHTGVLAISVNPVTRNLFVEQRDHTHNEKQTNSGWTAHACEGCRKPIHERGPLCGSQKTKVVELDHKWNDEAIHDNTEIVGYHGTFAIEKLRKIKEFVEK